MQIKYPSPLKNGDIIGITAPSSGIAADIESRLQFSIEQIRNAGFEVKLGKLLLSDGIVSGAAKDRAEELSEMLHDPSIKAIVPPWGGELLINVLPFLDFANLANQNPKWLVGYSDLSTLLLPFTTLTGIATLHGANLLETPFKAPSQHIHWLEAISRPQSSPWVQNEFPFFQKNFTRYQEFPNTTEWVCSDPNQWKILKLSKHAPTDFTVTGRLIGGCIDCISMLPGTPYCGMHSFGESFKDEGLLIYLELCEEKATTACRMLHHLKLAGWFTHARAILLGRTNAPNSHHLTIAEAFEDVFADINVPIIYDMDIGHLPPQMLLVNGARATVKFSPSERSIIQQLVA